MKLLIFIPSPRDIPEFITAITKIPHDKLAVKYVHYADEPYPQARQFFLDHKEYSHFAICPDDLIVNKKGVDQLWKDAKTGLDFIAGMCNVDLKDMNRLAMTYNLPSQYRAEREFAWYRKDDLKYKNHDIINVGWCGTPFAIMPRKVIEQFEFTGDIIWNPKGDKTESFDIQIAHDLYDLGIDEMVDTRVFFKHMRYAGEIEVGYKEPYMLYIQGKKKTKLPVESHY